LMVVAGYSISWILLPGYYTSAFPFFVIIIVAAGCATLRAAAALGPSARRAALGLVLAALTAHAVQGLAHGLWQVGLRHTASLGQPLSVTRLACWLEQATGPEDRVLDFYPLNALAARRRLPDGFEPAVQLKNWYALPPERQALIGAIALPELRALVADGRVPVIIDNDVASSLTDPFLPDYRADLARNYVLAGSLGGSVAPQHAWVEKRWLAGRGGTLPPFPSDEATRANLTLLRSEGASRFLAALADDLWHSVATLPRDVAASLARLLGASWEARCKGYMAHD
jgi:hypothetical protein